MTDTRRRPPRALVAFRAWRERHPALWSSRHVVLNLLGVVATLFGVSLLVRLVLGKLLPSLDLEIPKPDLPDWLGYLDPLHYLRPVLEWVAGLLPTSTCRTARRGSRSPSPWPSPSGCRCASTRSAPAIVSGMARTVDPAKHAARRAAILDAAAWVFAEKGYDGTTTADVHKAAGVGSGTLFHYFPDKGTLFKAMFDDDRPKLEAAVAAVTPLAPVDGLWALLDHLCGT